MVPDLRNVAKSLPSACGEPRYDEGDASAEGEPASARPSRLEMEGREHLVSSIGGDGGGRGGA